MQYKNAKNMLPDWLLEKLQDYVQGEVVYIPRKETIRVGWGEANGTREKYIERNMEIMNLYRNGIGVDDLSLRYCLSEYSIRKILSRTRAQVPRPDTMERLAR